MADVKFNKFATSHRSARIVVSSVFAVYGVALFEVSIITLASGVARGIYSGFAAISPDDLASGVLAALVFVLFGRLRGLYRLDCVISPSRHLRLAVSTIVASVFSVVLIFFFMKTGSDHSRVVLALFFVLASFGVCFGRAMAGRWLKSAIEAGAVAGKPVIMIGEKAEFSGVGALELLNFGIDEVARFELQGGEAALGNADRAKVLSAIALARRLRASEFALMMAWSGREALDEVLALLQESPLPVRLYPDSRTRDVLQKHRGGRFNPYLSIEVQREPLRRGERIVKRAIDIFVAATALGFLAPLLAIIALLIKIESQGPVVFRQKRMGFDKKVFTIFKFRTMIVQEDGENIEQARKVDLRVTRFGRLLRHTSLDELPQLWNVLRGEMSLVGPRPHALAHDVTYSVEIADYARRHHVKPGLTGAAQVRGYRGETRTVKQMADRVKWDLWYINNWSLTLDLRIFMQTFVSLISHESF